MAQYWEKRRVQNALRRLLEALQERFELTYDVQAADLGPIFDALASQVGCDAGASLDEAQLCGALEDLGLWPPELSANDRSEIFAALLVPSLAVARSVLSGQPMRTALTRGAFCEGFDRVPFNMPDFPVPIHLLSPALQAPLDRFTSEQMHAVAEAVATTFYMEKTGLGHVKDFFLCGVISLEEIQMTLPRLVPQTLVEDAVARIVQTGAPHFTPDEWQDLVVSLRTGDAFAAPQKQAHEAEQPPSPQRQEATHQGIEEPSTPRSQQHGTGFVSLASPVQQHHELLPPAGASRVDGGPCCPGSPSASAGNADPEPEATVSKFRGRFEPVTEPLPCRELRSEEPVSFAHSGQAPVAPAPQGPVRVVDWSTAAARGVDSSARGPRGGHQADEGAGVRINWGTSGFKQELTAALGKHAAGEGDEDGGADCLAWVSFDLHHECGGPYLTHAFVRCCQLYERCRLRET